MKSFGKSIFLVFCLLICYGCSDQDKDFEKEELKINLIDVDLKSAEDKSKSIEERKRILNKAYGVASTFPDSEIKIAKLHEISIKYYSLEDYNRFKQLNLKALKSSLKILDSVKIAKSYGYLGIYYRDVQLDSAYKNFYEADKIYLTFDKNQKRNITSYAFDHGKILLDLAQLSRKIKDYSKSEHFTIRAIKKFELSEDLSYLPVSYNNLGIVAKQLERYDDAVSYYSRVIEYGKNTNNDTLYAALGNNNIGTVYKTMKEYEKAEKYYKKALSYKVFLDKRPKRYARYLDNLAYVKFLSGNDTKSVLDLFYKSLKIRDSINDVIGISTNSLHLAEYYQSKENDSLAIYYAEQAKNASSKVHNNVELLRSYQLLSEVSQSDEGLLYAQKYIKLNDSLIKEERSYVNKFARIQFESEETKEKLTAISRENEILVIAVLGLTALFLLIYIIFRQQQSNKELLFAQQQQESNQEIYRLLLNQQVKLEEGRQLEQQRMSEELHDGVLGRLFGVRLSLDGINQRANDGFTEARNKYIEELKAIEKEIRLISHDLGTETLSPEVAYIDAVESLISDLCEAHKIDFEFRNDENIDWEEVDDLKKVNLFRILQESLQNIFKHAKAKMIKINFEYVNDKINLIILDDGIGFKSTKVKRGIGLKNITSRVSQMSGVVDFISNKDTGTTVSVSVPV